MISYFICRWKRDRLKAADLIYMATPARSRKRVLNPTVQQTVWWCTILVSSDMGKCGFCILLRPHYRNSAFLAFSWIPSYSLKSASSKKDTRKAVVPRLPADHDFLNGLIFLRFTHKALGSQGYFVWLSPNAKVNRKDRRGTEGRARSRRVPARRRPPKFIILAIVALIAIAVTGTVYLSLFATEVMS